MVRCARTGSFSSSRKGLQSINNIAGINDGRHKCVPLFSKCKLISQSLHDYQIHYLT